MYIGKSRQYWLNENINDSLFIMINDSLYYFDSVLNDFIRFKKNKSNKNEKKMKQKHRLNPKSNSFVGD